MNRLQIFTTNGTFISKLGDSDSDIKQEPGQPKKIPLTFHVPYDVAIGDGIVYVSESSHAVQMCQLDGTKIGQIGRFGTGDGEFTNPQGICFHDGLLYVCDSSLDRIQVFRKGVYVNKWNLVKSDGPDSKPCYPSDVACGKGMVFVVDQGNHCVQVFKPDGTFLYKFGNEGVLDGQFNYPRAITYGNGIVYVADSSLFSIQAFHPDGTFIRRFGLTHKPLGAPVFLPSDMKRFALPFATAEKNVALEMNVPWGLDFHDNKLYVAHYLLDQVHVFQ